MFNKVEQNRQSLGFQWVRISGTFKLYGKYYICRGQYVIGCPSGHQPWYRTRLTSAGCFNILRPRQNGRHFADAIFKRIFFNENVWISIKISLKFVPKGPINIITAMFQIMAWRRPGDKPLSGPMIVRLPTHICFTRPQWVNSLHQNKVTIPLNNDVNYSAPRYQVQNCHISHERFSHCSMFSELMMTSSNENIFRVTGHLCGEFTGQRWIPRTKASDAELWCFLWSVP